MLQCREDATLRVTGMQSLWNMKGDIDNMLST